MKIGNIRLGCGRRLGSVEAGTQVYFVDAADEATYSLLGFVASGSTANVLVQSDQGERFSFEVGQVFTSRTKCLSVYLRELRNRAIAVRSTLVEARAARKAAKAAVTPAVVDVPVVEVATAV